MLKARENYWNNSTTPFSIHQLFTYYQYSLFKKRNPPPADPQTPIRSLAGGPGQTGEGTNPRTLNRSRSGLPHSARVSLPSASGPQERVTAAGGPGIAGTQRESRERTHSCIGRRVGPGAGPCASCCCVRWPSSAPPSGSWRLTHLPIWTP